jgi:hypothetical protein
LKLNFVSERSAPNYKLCGQMVACVPSQPSRGVAGVTVYSRLYRVQSWMLTLNNRPRTVLAIHWNISHTSVSSKQKGTSMHLQPSQRWGGGGKENIPLPMTSAVMPLYDSHNCPRTIVNINSKVCKPSVLT